ncbi:hypothetical protein F511_06463 [Dorcoceras hygrometricum]|uniref:Uncharacterized protein n=1 Tax=Dorcoceras hygrometricum TaxID=472368 RepID=A0A2Z7D8M9_9LAMI|nr:hypothetical protein F511_06463 [Dorcoceras hygrometricum]
MIIIKEMFSGIFQLATEGLVVVSDFPKRMVAQMKMEFSDIGVPLKSSCKKKAIKVDYRLLNDIIAKAPTAKSRSSMW